MGYCNGCSAQAVVPLLRRREVHAGLGAGHTGLWQRRGGGALPHQRRPQPRAAAGANRGARAAAGGCCRLAPGRQAWPVGGRRTLVGRSTLPEHRAAPQPAAAARRCHPFREAHKRRQAGRPGGRRGCRALQQPLSLPFIKAAAAIFRCLQAVLLLDADFVPSPGLVREYRTPQVRAWQGRGRGSGARFSRGGGHFCGQGGLALGV